MACCGRKEGVGEFTGCFPNAPPPPPAPELRFEMVRLKPPSSLDPTDAAPEAELETLNCGVGAATAEAGFTGASTGETPENRVLAPLDRSLSCRVIASAAGATAAAASR
jgi:hypothetical protein